MLMRDLGNRLFHDKIDIGLLATSLLCGKLFFYEMINITKNLL